MYDKRILAAGMAVSIGAVALIGVLVAASGVAYAVPLAGVGGFTVEAEEIRGESMFMYPGVEETSERDAQPVAVTEMQSTEIEGLRLTKEMDASPLPGLDGTMRVVIHQTGDETVETGQQMLKFSQLRASESQFSGQVVDEHNSDDPREQFDIAAPGDAQEGRTVDISGEEPGLVLRNAEIQAHYLAVSSISIPDIAIDVEYDEGESPDQGGLDDGASEDQSSGDSDGDGNVVNVDDSDEEKNHDENGGEDTVVEQETSADGESGDESGDGTQTQDDDAEAEEAEETEAEESSQDDDAQADEEDDADVIEPEDDDAENDSA